MQKELNPELFGEKIETKNKLFNANQNYVNVNSADTQFLDVDHQIFEVKGELSKLSDKFNLMNLQVAESVKSNQTKYERMAQAISRLEHSHNGLVQEAGSKIAQLSSKMSERKAMDMKMQELIDRHNNILRSFEVRLSQMQKMLAEKDAQLVSAIAALNETKMEISRLKRL